MQQLVYYKIWQKFISKCVRFFIAIILTKYDSYYEMRRLLQNASVYLFILICMYSLYGNNKILLCIQQNVAMNK